MTVDKKKKGNHWIVKLTDCKPNSVECCIRFMVNGRKLVLA